MPDVCEYRTGRHVKVISPVSGSVIATLPLLRPDAPDPTDTSLYVVAGGHRTFPVRLHGHDSVVLKRNYDVPDVIHYRS